MCIRDRFASQSSIAAAVKHELDTDMDAFGFEIVNVLVTDIVPDMKVKAAMNDINAAQRELVAAAAPVSYTHLSAQVYWIEWARRTSSSAPQRGQCPRWSG